MKILQKLLAMGLTLLLLPAALAEAAPELSTATANGSVEAQKTYDILAPYSGTLLPFDLSMGDAVEPGEKLFFMDTQKVFSPADGKITLFAAPGDSTQDVIRQYGALASIEKASRYVIDANTHNAYNDKENKFVSVGELLYFKLSEDNDEEGQGRVVAASPSGYTVEIAQGEYELGKRAKLYRQEKKDDKSRVGDGLIVRAAEQPVMGGGRILQINVTDGATVRKGDLLFDTVAEDAELPAEQVIVAPSAGVLEAPAVISGQQVYKGQRLVTLHDTTQLKVVAQVDEVDLPRLHDGSGVTLVFDSYPGQSVPGVVASISRMGVAKQNATYYNVDISFSTQLDIRLGMNVTVTLP